MSLNKISLFFAVSLFFLLASPSFASDYSTPEVSRDSSTNTTYHNLLEDDECVSKADVKKWVVTQNKSLRYATKQYTKDLRKDLRNKDITRAEYRGLIKDARKMRREFRKSVMKSIRIFSKTGELVLYKKEEDDIIKLFTLDENDNEIKITGGAWLIEYKGLLEDYDLEEEKVITKCE